MLCFLYNTGISLYQQWVKDGRTLSLEEIIPRANPSSAMASKASSSVSDGQSVMASPRQDGLLPVLCLDRGTGREQCGSQQSGRKHPGRKENLRRKMEGKTEEAPFVAGENSCCHILKKSTSYSQGGLYFCKVFAMRETSMSCSLPPSQTSRVVRAIRRRLDFFFASDTHS